jgi:concanavalin A-like lectin/glucanase superfamily protein
MLLPVGNAIPRFSHAEWQEEPDGGYAIKQGRNRVFKFTGLGNRVSVQDTPPFHFGTNQDFSVEAWIRAYPPPSKAARQLKTWIGNHPATLKFTPGSIVAWINNHATDNDYGVTPIVDKHHTPSPSESVGFQLYLDYGRLACQLAEPPMRQLTFQNFISPGPSLQDRRWHHVAMSVERNSATGGKLYVDGQLVLTFDPTSQTGDLSNSEPLRIGNHANPNLRCFYKGTIGNVVLYRRALRADEVAGGFRKGRFHP